VGQVSNKKVAKEFKDNLKWVDRLPALVLIKTFDKGSVAVSTADLYHIGDESVGMQHAIEDESERR
jgi:hypothetical protein